MINKLSKYGYRKASELTKINNLIKPLLDCGYDIDQIYAKTLKEVITYSDEVTEEVAFKSIFHFAYICVVEEDEIVDMFMQPINSFRLRTNQDKKSLESLVSVFEKELQELEGDTICDA